MKQFWSLFVIAIVFIGSLVGSLYFLYQQDQENAQELSDRFDRLESKQRQELALITSSFRELQRGLQIENAELETLLQQQEQEFTTQLQDIERQKSISDQLLTRDNQELAQNINELSEKLVDLESVSKPALIAKWSDVAVKISCRYESGARTFGSGMYVDDTFDVDFVESPQNIILSNSHVLEEEGEVPTSCTIRWNDATESETDVADGQIAYFEDLDAAFMVIAEDMVPDYIKNSTATYTTCDLLPTSGDELVVLGYPKIGSSDGITSTEGIVSGYDNPFYVTSAKISRGSSGGLAIASDRDCYVGIPTLVRADEVESLGRILDIQSLLQQQ